MTRSVRFNYQLVLMALWVLAAALVLLTMCIQVVRGDTEDIPATMVVLAAIAAGVYYSQKL